MIHPTCRSASPSLAAVAKSRIRVHSRGDPPPCCVATQREPYRTLRCQRGRHQYQKSGGLGMDATERLGAVVILIGMGSALAYPVLQVIALRQFRGFWRLLAAVPLLPMGYIIVVTALALRQQ